MKKSVLLLLAIWCFTMPLLAQIDQDPNCLNRKEAVEYLLSDASGIAIDLDISSVWSPFVDFGFGPGFEGLLPKGTIVGPAFLDVDPYPGEEIELEEEAYFFWVDDDAANHRFVHPTRFVLLYTGCGDESADMDLLVSEQGWWPVIQTEDGTSNAYFSTNFERKSDDPPSYSNKDGLIAGNPTPIPDFVEVTNPLLLEKANSEPKAYGIVVKGGSGGFFDADRDRYCEDLNQQGVPDANIVKANNGGVADLEDLEEAIKKVCELGAGKCTKIYVKITSHGGKGKLILGGDRVSSDTLCSRFRALSKKKVPICYLIDACFSGSLIDSKIWDAPPGSSVVTATDGGHTTGGGTYCVDGDSLNKVTGSVFSHAFSKCLKDTMADTNKDGKVNDCEAFEWIKKKKPCYQAGSKRRYPGGPPSGTTGVDPKPQKEKIKTMSLEVIDGQTAGRKYSAPQNETVKLETGQCFKLSVPSDATNIVWKLNGEPISEEQGQGKTEIKRTAPKVGDTDVYMVSYVYNEEEYSYMMSVVGVKGKGTGEPIIKPIYEINKLNNNFGNIGFVVNKVYPNPFVETFNVELFALQEEKIQMQLTDLDGRVYYQQSFEVVNGFNTIEIQTNGQLSKGIFLMQLIDANGRSVTKKITMM